MIGRTKLKKAAATAAVAVPTAGSALFLFAEAASAAPAAGSYVVQPGDTLSQIAASHGTSWSALAEANHLANPNLIFPGQVIVLDPPTSASPAPSHSTVSASDPDGDGDTDGSVAAEPTSSEPVHTSAPAQTSTPAPTSESSTHAVSAAPVSHTSTSSSSTSSSSVSSSSVTPTSSFQSCVIQRESGGNAQVVNSSGHYGLYQFSASTWAAYGGSPALFGHASAAQQTQVFNNAIAAGGQSNWAPYNGC